MSLERRCSDRVVGLERGGKQPLPRGESEVLKSLGQGIHIPAAAHAEFGIDGELIRAVDGLGRGRQDFAYPNIGRR